MHRVNVSLLCLLSLSFAGSVFGQTADSPQSGPSGFATYDSYSGGATLGSGTYMNVRHMTGPGVGYSGSYTQIGGFVPLWFNEDGFIAPDVRMMATNSSQVGGNAGLVARRYLPGMDRIIGGYGYFDVDQSASSNTYSQSSFGLETLGRFWDVRANGYFPNGRQDNFVSTGSAISVMGNPYLLGNNIVFNGSQGQNREQAVSGFDAEFGLPMFPSTPWLRAYAGMYAYSTYHQQPVATCGGAIPNQTHSNPVGFRGRIDAWISDDLLAGVNVTTDPVWGTNVNAVIDFRFSGFKPTRYFPQWIVRERMLAPVQRNWRVAVDPYGTAVNTPIAAVNPTTGNPYFVDFINNAAPAGGNGTFEHPFNSFNFPAGLPGADIIFVERGNSSLANPYVGSITLFNNQRLLGEGVNSTPIPLSATYGNCSVSGTFPLPGFNGSGNYPFVTNGGGTTPIVTLANGNEVGGFNFVNAGGDAIYGNNVNNFNLHDLQISGNAGRGIALINATGNSTIISNINLPTGTDNPNPDGIGNNAGGGILVSSGAGGLGSLQLSNIFMNSNPVGTSPYGISLSATNGPLYVTETSVTTNGNVVGQQWTETNRVFNATVNGATANGNTADGIDAFGTGGSITVNATNSTTPLITNNNTGTGFVLGMNGGAGILNFTGSQGNNNGGDGLGVYGTNGASITYNLTNVQLNGNTRDGLHKEGTGGSHFYSTVDPSSLSNNGRDGYYYLLSGNSTSLDNFNTDALNSNGGSGFSGSLNASSVNLTLTNISGTGSGQHGFHLDMANGSLFTGTVNNANFTGSTVNGFDIQLAGASEATFNLTHVEINTSGQNGIGFLSDTGSSLIFNANNVSINGNGGSGIFGTVQNSSAATVNVTGPSTISTNVGDGVTITGTNLGNFVGSFDDTTINGNSGNGIHLNLSDSKASTLSLTSVAGPTTVNSNGANGIWLQTSNNAYLVPTINGVTIQGNTLDGLRMDAASGSALGGAPIAGTFTNVTILDNATNGIESNVDGVGTISNLVFTGGESSNSTGTSPQQTGYLFNVTNNGSLNTTFTGGMMLNNNGQNAVNGTVTGTGTASSASATILLDGTNAGGSGANNVQLNVAQGGFLKFTGQNGAIFSNSLTGAGVSATVNDLNSLAIVDLNGATVNGNKTVGFTATVTDSIAPAVGQTGAALISDLEATSFNNNVLQGLLFNVNGAGATAYIGAGTTTAGTQITVNSNGQEGLLANASNQGTINFREIGSSFNNNGNTGAYFGGNDGTIRVLFYGGTTNGNKGDGLGFGPVAPNSSDFLSNYIISLGNGFTSTNNTGYGLDVNGNGANAVDLIQDPSTAPIVLSGNGAGAENLNFTGVNQVLLQLLGSFNGSAGDGVHLNFNNITTAIVSINGLGSGTINNNAGDGIYVQMVDVTNAAVTVSGFSSISNNGGDGVHIEMTGITKQMNGAIEVQGVTGDTTFANNGLNGVNIELTKTNLVNPFSSLPGVNLIVLTPTSNQPLDASAPLPIFLPPGSNGVIPSHALTLDSLNVINTGTKAAAGNGNGILVNGTDSSIVANDGFITNNTVNGSAQGAGIAVTMNNTVAPTVPTISGLTVSGNYVGAVNPGLNYLVTPTASPNNGDGILISVTNAFNPNGPTADGVTINNNVVTGNLGNGIDFLINNPSGSTSTANNVTMSGNTIQSNQGIGLNIDLAYVQMNGLTISNDTILSNQGDGIQANLLGVNWSNLTTSGNTVDSNTQNGLDVILDKSFITTWTAAGGDYSKNMLAGLQITNSGTSSVTGGMFTGVTIDQNGTDGIQMTTTDASKSIFGSVANPIIFNGGTILDNGRLAAGNGVNMTTLANGSMGNLVFLNEQIGNTLPNKSQLNGLIYDVDKTGGAMDANFVGGSISNNKIDAINGAVNGTSVVGGSSSTMALTGTTVTGNGGTGLLFNVNNAGTMNVLIQDNSGTGSNIAKNGGDGLQINASDKGTVVNATVLNSTILDNGQSASNMFNGISLNLTNYYSTNVANLTVTNSTIGNTAGTTQNDGIFFNLDQNGPVPAAGIKDGLIVKVTNSTLTNNSASALEGSIVGPAGGANLTTGAFITFNKVTANSNGGNGVALNLFQGGMAAFTANNQTTINGNAQNGLFINATDANTLAAVLIEDSSINNNGTLVFPGDGINATAVAGAVINIGADTTGAAPVSFSGNTGNGINVLVDGVNSGSDIDLHNAFLGLSAANGFTGNTLNGLTFQSIDGAYVHMRAYDTAFDGNGKAGLLGAVNDTNGNNTEGIVNIIGGEANGNLGDGYSLSASNTAGGAGFGVATLTGQFQADANNVGISAQNNGGYGLNFVASNGAGPVGGIVGNLLMTGGSKLLNNGLGTLNVNMNGADQAIIGLSGTFDGSTTGDGISVNLSNITGLALVSLQGPGEVKNNAGNGINVTMTNVFQGGVFIGGFTGGITGNGNANGAGGLGQDGIKVTMNNVGSGVGGAGALTINGQTASNPAPATMNVSNNSGNGVNVDIKGGSIIDNTAFNTLLGAKLVKVVDFTPPDQLIQVAHPNYPPVPNPLLTTSLQNVSSILGITLTPSVSIQNLVLDNNGNATAGNMTGGGILFTLDGSTIIGAPSINNNTITNTGIASTTKGANMHDGIQVDLLNGAGFAAGQAQFNIVNNFVGVTSAGVAGGNNGNGINFIENDPVAATAPYSTLQTLNISSNTVANSTGLVGVSGNGIVLQLPNAPTLATITLDTDIVLNNAGDGVQMLNPNTGFSGSTFNNNLTVNFTNDTINGNGTAGVTSSTTLYPPGTMGVDIVLSSSNADTTTNPGTAIPETTIINVLSGTGAAGTQFNTISNNKSFGLFVQAVNNAAYNLNVTEAPGVAAQNAFFNVFNANADAGIAIVAGSSTTDLTKFSVGNIRIDDVAITGTLSGNHGASNYPFLGDGVAILTQQYAEIASLVIGDQTVRNTQLSTNQGDGLRIDAIGNSEFRQTTKNAQGQDTSVVTQLGQATIQMQNIDATLNGVNGIEILHQDAALLSWDDATANGALGANLFLSSSDPNYPVSWSYITGGVSDQYTYTNTANQLNSYVYKGPGNVSGTNPAGYDGSFIHMNDVIANQNAKNGLYVDTTNQQFPMTRIDIVDYLQNGDSQFGAFDSVGTNLGNGLNGMLFNNTAKSITVVHAQDTYASGNRNDGILVTTFNAASFGDVQTSVPAGDPTSPTAELSTFNGMTINGNGNALTAAAGGGNGLEVISNGSTDVASATSSAVVGISMTNSTSANTLNAGGRNLFDNNAGDSIKFTANRYSTNYLSLNAVDMRHSGTVNANLGGSGIHFLTHDFSTTTLKDINTTIGTPTSDLGVKGLVGNGIWVADDGHSNMAMLIGDQTIANPPPPNTDLNGGSADVKIFDNGGAGILVSSTNNARFFGETYDTASIRNANRGYSALIAQSALAIHQINYSNMSDNGREGIAVVANAEEQSSTLLIVPKIATFAAEPYNVYNFLTLNPQTVGGLVLTNSTINDNGNPTPYYSGSTNVNGVEIDVSSWSYVSADIRNNYMLGNTLADFATASFQASSINGPGWQNNIVLYNPNTNANVTVQSMDPTGANGLTGFLADGTINPFGKLNAPKSVENILPKFDGIAMEDAAQLDVRFINNVGNKLSPNEGAGNNNYDINQGGLVNDGQLGQSNATGAWGTDQTHAKYNSGTGSSGNVDPTVAPVTILGQTGRIGQSIALFQVDAYHYDTVSSVTQAAGPTPFSFSGTNVLPLDAPTAATVLDFANFPGAITVNLGATSTSNRSLQAGIVNQDQFYTNLNPTAFTGVRIDDLTRGIYEPSQGTTIVTNYAGATGTFTMNNGGIPLMQSGDVFRVHLLDTNSFTNNGNAVDVEAAFLPPIPFTFNVAHGFVNPGIQNYQTFPTANTSFTNYDNPFTNLNPLNPISGTTGVGTIRIPQGGDGVFGDGTFYAPNPLAPYFDFPSASFPPY